MSAILEALVGFLLLSNVAAAAMPSAMTTTMPIIPSGPSYSVTMTAYNAVPAQTDATPLVTASGAYSNPQVVAARSQDFAQELPFGTIIQISGPSYNSGTCGYETISPLIGYRIIADTMNARFTDRIDVLMSTKANYIMPDGLTKNASNILGLCNGVIIRVVGHINLMNPTNLPASQEALVAILKKDNSFVLNK